MQAEIKSTDKETIADPVWRKRLVLFDVVLIALLGWLLWGSFSGGSEDPAVEAGSNSAAPEQVDPPAGPVPAPGGSSDGSLEESPELTATDED